MRRPWVVAGLSAAALYPAIAGVRFVQARTEAWPPPSITVTPNTARFASEVAAEDLSKHIRARLRRFIAAPLSGHLDPNGKDRLKAWVWTHLARAAVQVYRLNHDPQLIALVLQGAAKYEVAASRHDPELGYGWYTEDTRAKGPYREVPVTGLIMAPMVDLLLESQRDPELAKLVAPHRERLLLLLRRAIVGLDQRYIEEGGRGYYLLPSGDDVEPINLMSVYARPLLGLWQLTRDAESLREVTGIARTWKAALSLRGDGSVTWPHTPRPSTIAARPDPAEVMIKSSAAIEFPMAAFEAGLVLGRQEIEALARAPATTLLNRVDDTHYQLRGFVDVNSDAFVNAASTDIGTVLRPASWYQYGCYDPLGNQVLDPYLFGIDAKFYRLSGLALLSMAQRLVIEGNPQRCSPAKPTAELSR
jgi:hypothetical protein